MLESSRRLFGPNKDILRQYMSDSAPWIPLGKKWFNRFYQSICNSLGIESEDDQNTRDLLSKLIPEESKIQENLEAQIRGKPAVVFGAGPSLEFDIVGLNHYLREKRPVVFCADGAADALRQERIDYQALVTDLDSCSQDTIEATARKTPVFVHAHGANADLVQRIVPRLNPDNVIGTTQVEPLRNVQNYGGFTDGDRACFVATNFSPESIIIAGMDFGKTEGPYSVNRYSKQTNPLRERKLGWGKASLEFVVSENPEIRFANVTKFGVDITGTKKVSYTEATANFS
jgi:2-amino-4-hydroxy-6-hydroxymethyldihydropteridine diphosphokinase